MSSASKPLILTPTAFEAKGVLGAAPAGGDAIAMSLGGVDLSLALCGFGLAAAGALAATQIARLKPSCVVHVGLAGTYEESAAPLGGLVLVRRIFCHGIGVGHGRAHRTVEDIGFVAAPGHASTADRLEDPTNLAAIRGAACSVAAVAESVEAALAARRRFPDALIEDMESWSVALACAAAKTPLLVLRAVANVAGDRDKSRWKVAAALAAIERGLSSPAFAIWARSFAADS